jgi:ketosteroid isomerase-like protein
MPSTTLAPAILSEPDLQAQKELDEAFCSAMSRKDLDGVMRCLWNDPNLVVVLWDATVYRGSEAIRAAAQQLFDTFPVVRLGIDEVSHVPVGDGVVAVGTATYNLQAKDGSAVRIVERWTDLRRKVEGRWVYVLDHAHELPKLN